jgi:hypothetical protein
MTAAPNPLPDNPLPENVGVGVGVGVGGELDAGSLNAIRSILIEDPAPSAPASRSSADLTGAGAQETAASQDVPAAQTVRPRRKADALPELGAAIDDGFEDPDAPRAKAGLLSRLRRKTAAPAPAATMRAVDRTARRNDSAAGGRFSGLIPDGATLSGYRPKPAHITLGLLVLVVLMRPWLVIGLLALVVFIMIGVFLIAGYDGFWHGVMKSNRWYAKRRPERAALILARLDRFAMRWDGVLDRFPEGTVDGLYLPDFGDMDAAERRHTEAMDRRLSGLQGKGV